MERAGGISDEAVRRFRKDEGVAGVRQEGGEEERGERSKGRKREGKNRERLANHVATIPPG